MSSIISGISQASGAISGVSQAARGVGKLASDLGNLGSGNYGAITNINLGPWASSLQPASWRGQPFAVRESQIQRGRRIAVHEYPYRDTVWVEDLGRAMRRISFRGFLIGDDVFAQRDAMSARAEMAGPGTLVHPSLGSIRASLAEFSAGERAELGRVVEIEFAFIEAGQLLYPSIAVSTQGAVSSAADAAGIAIGSDFGSSVVGALKNGAQVVQSAVKTVSTWTGTALKLAGDAALITGAVKGMTGNFGRYSGGSRSGALLGVATVQGALSQTTTAVTGVTKAAQSLANLGNLL